MEHFIDTYIPQKHRQNLDSLINTLRTQNMIEGSKLSDMDIIRFFYANDFNKEKTREAIM